MKNRVMAACAVVCTLSVLSMVCLGQIKKNRSVSHFVLTNVETLTDNELPSVTITCDMGGKGKCYRHGTMLVMCGEYNYYACEYTGKEEDTCYPPCDY